VSAPLDSITFTTQMETTLVGDLKFPDLMAAWTGFQLKEAENAKMLEGKTLLEEKRNQEVTKRRKQEAMEIEADRLWRAWWEFNYPPKVTTDGNITFSVSIMRPRPGKQMPDKVRAWQTLWQRLLGTIPAK